MSRAFLVGAKVDGAGDDAEASIGVVEALSGADLEETLLNIN